MQKAACSACTQTAAMGSKQQARAMVASYSTEFHTAGVVIELSAGTHKASLLDMDARVGDDITKQQAFKNSFQHG